MRKCCKAFAIQLVHHFIPTTFLILLFNVSLTAQNASSEFVNANGLTQNIPELDDSVSLSISNWSLQELVRGITKFSNINIVIDENVDSKVTANFTNVKIADVLSFLCNKYGLSIQNQGNIIILSAKPPAPIDDSHEVIFDSRTGLLSIDVSDTELITVIKKITRATGANIISKDGAEQMAVSLFVKDLSVNRAIEQLAYANNMDIEMSRDSIYYFSLKQSDQIPSNDRQGSSRDYGQNSRRSSRDQKLSVRPLRGDSIEIYAENAEISEIIMKSCSKLQRNFFISSKIEGTKTLEVKPQSFTDFISDLLKSTDYTYLIKNGTYFFGKKDLNDLKETRVVSLYYRTATKLTDYIPKSLKDDVEIVEFLEQNSLIISGPYDKVDKLERFILSIDKPIPVILIEVIIVNVKKSLEISTGIEAGLSETVKTTQGVFFPEIDMQLSSASINKALKSIKGVDFVNIGVKENVYLVLKAMEEQGFVEIKSTPKLSTLNGHEASMSIGETEYYEEESSNIVGSVSATVSSYTTYKSVDAELSVTITPIVSGTNEITLDIEVKQSDFTSRIKTTAPPGIVNREFKSIIKVQNKETIILGGLEENRKSQTASGVPFLSRVPIIKWFFSSRSKSKSKNQLNVFIKPTIIN